MDQLLIAIAAGLLVGMILAVPKYFHERKSKSRDMFRTVRKYLKDHRNELVTKAFQEYHQPFLEGDVPFLFQKEWLPEKPVLLSDIKIKMDGDHDGFNNETKVMKRLKGLLPYSETGAKYGLYTNAIDMLDRPKLFINRESYRLEKISCQDGTPYFSFSLCEYFDHINIGELFAYEAAKRAGKPKLSTFQKSKRQKFGDPYNLSNRYVTPGINTLTIRKEESNHTFFMLKRNSANVATGMSSYHVLPAGEFQPASISPISLKGDLDFWKNIMREYGEELLGHEEYYGDEGFTVDYKNEPFKSFNNALDTGKVKCYYLGFGMDPLTLKGEILTVCVWDALEFDKIFANMNWENEEGKIIGSNVDKANHHLYGIPFCSDYIDQYVKSNTIPAGMACLRLAWKYRAELGLA